jgi:hypothetical protein
MGNADTASTGQRTHTACQTVDYTQSEPWREPNGSPKRIEGEGTAGHTPATAMQNRKLAVEMVTGPTMTPKRLKKEQETGQSVAHANRRGILTLCDEVQAGSPTRDGRSNGRRIRTRHRSRGAES